MTLHPSSELEEHFNIQWLLLLAKGEEDVTPDELMNDLQVCRDSVEEESAVFMVNTNLSGLPVDVPGTHCTVPPCLPVLQRLRIHQDQTVVGNTNHILGEGGIQRQAYSRSNVATKELAKSYVH